MTIHSFRRGNHLLDMLPADDWRALDGHLELILLRKEEILSQAGDLIRTVYFPTTAVVSLLQTMKDGNSVEIAAIGRDGTTGVPIVTGGETMPAAIQCQCPGFAYRMTAQVLRNELRRSVSLHRLMLLYMQVLLTQVAQTAACNRFHRLDEQVCRWLLIDIDRSGKVDLPVTQQLIADMLGVRREGVTQAIRKLWDANLIEHRRGRIRVVDRAGVEARSCECYDIVRRGFNLLLPVVGGIVEPYRIGVFPRNQT
jgi:CRP-like cAMP-binding protein